MVKSRSRLLLEDFVGPWEWSLVSQAQAHQDTEPEVDKAAARISVPQPDLHGEHGDMLVTIIQVACLTILDVLSFASSEACSILTLL